ncbi:MAG: amidohydrolase family protein [Chloroflexota bacterium]|nr:amidohydrolase family protein [Chloroflexota bacterium]
MIIDFHTHYLAREHFQMHAKTPDGRIVGSSVRGEGKDAIVEANGNPLGSSCNPEDFYNLAARLDHMHESGVDMQVLSPPPFMCFTEIPGTEAARFAREQNEAIAAVVQHYPNSFRGLGVAPVQDAENAVTEIAYLMDTLKLDGIEILTQLAGKNLDTPDLDPVWQALDARGALVFIHPLYVLGAERLSKYYLTNLLGNPVETAVALASLMFSGVLERFPHIRFLAAHGGGVAPFVIGRWEHAARVRPELAHLPASPLDLLRRAYVDTIVHGAPELLHLVEMLGAQRIVLGSDFPFDMGTKEPVSLFGASLPEDVRQQILAQHQDLLRSNDMKEVL